VIFAEGLCGSLAELRELLRGKAARSVLYLCKGIGAKNANGCGGVYQRELLGLSNTKPILLMAYGQAR
jgi:hypothetical protein